MSTTTTDAQATLTQRWRIDPARSSIEFHTPTLWGLATVRGRFERYDGTLDLRRQPAIELTLDAAGLDTKNKLRDKHLRSADFFDVENHPQVRFVSDHATLDGERLNVRGELHAGGRTMPVELTATLRRVGSELDVEAATDADHHLLGMTHSTLGMIRTPSKLIIHGRLINDGD